MERILCQQKLPAPCPTPLVRQGPVWCKPEGKQVTGSVKYRLVYAKVMAALAAGRINERTVLTEVISGSTGVALAYVGARLGVRVELHAYHHTCPRTCARIRAYGGKLILHPPDTSVVSLLTLVASQVQQGSSWHLNQYDRRSIIEAYQALGQEIVQQLDACEAPPPQMFACPVGTGGLIQGVGSYLRQKWPELKIVAVEPAPHARIPGMRNTQIWHMGSDDPYDIRFPDARLTVYAPEKRVHVGGFVLGNSATAVYELVRKKEWEDVLIIAPD